MKTPASSELEVAAALLAELREAGLLLTSRRPALAAASSAAAAAVTASPPPAPGPPRPAALPSRPPEVAVRSLPSAAPAPAGGPPLYRADRIRQLLANLCKRGGFSAAMLADRSGLALAEFNSPFELDSLAAFASVAGEALEQAGKLLGKRDANNLSLDINYVEKIVVRRFLLAQQPAFLLLVCPQSIDERSEVELSIDLIVAVLAEES